MPIEIRELTIKATVTNADREEASASSHSASNTKNNCPDKDPLAEQIAEILKRKNER